MELQGKVLEVFDTVKVTDSFQKREFVVEYSENPSFPEFIKFETIQDRCSLLDSVQPNDMVKVQFNLKGRKWTDRNGEVKYFNSLQAWRLEPVGAAGADAPPPPDDQDWGAGSNDDTDVLPF